jgi:hypothetical protein
MKKGTSPFIRVAVLSMVLGAVAAVSTVALAANATATLSPSSLSFGNVKVGTTSTAKKATLTNNGPETITVSPAPSATGQFDVSSTTCGTLTANSSCTISVVFKPTSSGAKAGTLDVSTDASTPPSGNLQISLSGTGTLPVATLSSTAVSFGNWAVGVTSSPKSVKLANGGKAGLKITSISASGDFKQSNNCGASLAAGNTCTITLTFKPSKLGSRTGTLSVKDDAASGTQTASLSGTGVRLSVSLNPTTLNFRIERIHTTSFARSATLTNLGAVTLAISDISASKGYTHTDTCGTSVAAGASCTISVTFSPTTEGSYSGAVTIKDNAGTQQLDLTGIGGFPAFAAKAKTLSFNKQVVASSSLPKDVKLTNTGTDKLFINAISIKGDFSQTNTCEPYINPGITCTVSVTFTPKAEKTRKGLLTIDQELGVYKVSLSGIGIAAPLASQSPTPSQPSAAPTTSGPSQVLRGHRLPTSLKLVALVGLLLLLGGGAFLVATQRGDEQPQVDPSADAEAVDALGESPDGGGVGDGVGDGVGIATLDELLQGLEDLPETPSTVPAPPVSDDEAEERQIAAGANPIQDEDVPEGELYDWASDPESQLK